MDGFNHTYGHLLGWATTFISTKAGGNGPLDQKDVNPIYCFV